METNVIEINSSNKEKATGLDIVAFQWAAGGACGEPGGVVFITKDSNVYHTNYVFDRYGITWDDLCEIFPPLLQVKAGIFGGGFYPEGWKDQYLGLVNYLVVHESIWETFSDMAHKALEHPHNVDDYAILYNIWVDVVLNTLGKS